jgi:hypothetical protein
LDEGIAPGASRYASASIVETWGPDTPQAPSTIDNRWDGREQRDHTNFEIFPKKISEKPEAFAQQNARPTLPSARK